VETCWHGGGLVEEAGGMEVGRWTRPSGADGVEVGRWRRDAGEGARVAPVAAGWRDGRSTRWCVGGPVSGGVLRPAWRADGGG
jgi:hypothetical protein